MWARSFGVALSRKWQSKFRSVLLCFKVSKPDVRKIASLCCAAFTSEQMVGAALVVCGAALVAGGDTTGAASVSVSFSSLFVISMLFPAISSTLKERIFIVAREKFVDHDLDVFVVNTCSSIAQVRPAVSMTGVTFSSMTSGVCQVLATICRYVSKSPVG